MLGINLDLDMTDLNDIHTMYHVAGTNALKIMMFDKWLKKCPAASWDDVIQALTDMGEVTTADRIKAGRPPKTGDLFDVGSGTKMYLMYTWICECAFY